MMNRERLIEAIRQRTCLWNRQDVNYHSSEMKQEKWEEISGEMGIVGTTLKKRWELLRDGFRRELKKSYSIPKFQSGWPFYNQMLFLKDNMTPRGRGSFLQSTEMVDYETFDDESQEQYNDTFDKPSTSDYNVRSEMYIKEEPLPPVDDNKAASDPGTANDSLPGPKRNKAVKIVQDDDYHFLMSLLPSLKKINEDMKLKVRIKLMEVLQKEVETPVPGRDPLDMVDMSAFEKDVARI